jgi:hypothetical protein
MGCCFSCFRGYKKIPDLISHNFDGDILLSNGKVNFNSSVFRGLLVDQKFTNTSSFDKRFIWVNYETKTLHMSQHESKEGRHKEASLTDIKTIEQKPPLKLRKKADDTNNNDDVYLTISFVRGGSIDLKFKSVEERNVWHTTLNKLISEK